MMSALPVWLPEILKCQCVCVCVCVCLHACVCVCVREREREYVYMAYLEGRDKQQREQLSKVSGLVYLVTSSLV